MAFGTGLKLIKYLNRSNLELLDTVLKGLTTPAEAEAFQHFWGWFGRQEGMTTAQIEHAVRSLRDLRRILKEHLAGGI
jgi:hypothetical protein